MFTKEEINDTISFLKNAYNTYSEYVNKDVKVKKKRKSKKKDVENNVSITSIEELNK